MSNLIQNNETLKKHVKVDHPIIKKMFEEEVNNRLKTEMERQLVTKISNQFGNVIINFFLSNIIFIKIKCNRIFFKKDTGLLIAKKHLPM